MNENAIETIVQWFWEPLSDECKEVIKSAKDYNTIEGFLIAIFRYNFRYIFKRLDIDDEMYLSDFDVVEFKYGNYTQEIVPEKIEIVGLCTCICVVSNALILKALYPDTEITVDASCCACVTPESHKAALLTMKMCQINVVGE